MTERTQPPADAESPSPADDGDAGYDVPPNADPHRCPHCEAPFTDEELLALHRGLAHEGALTADERDAFEAAYEAENEDIRRFRLKALALLVVLYFGLLMAFSVFA
jgi:hypothetical protein